MRPFLAKELFDLQQKVVERCLRLAALEIISEGDADGKRRKEEFLYAAEKAMEVEELFLVHIPEEWEED